MTVKSSRSFSGLKVLPKFTISDGINQLQSRK